MTADCAMLLLIAAAPSESARVGYVIDGDTFRPASGERIRIAGFDAPATDDDPKRFKERLGKLVKHKPVVKSQLSCNARSRPLAVVRRRGLFAKAGDTRNGRSKALSKCSPARNCGRP